MDKKFKINFQLFAETGSDKGVAYLNVKNGKFAVKDDTGAYGTPEAFPYLNTIPLSTNIGNQDIYADGKKLITIYSDTGYTGNIGTTAMDTNFERALGMSIPGDGGTDIAVKINSTPVFAFYYEFDKTLPSGRVTVIKNWLVGATAIPSNRDHNTNTNAPAIGTYQYPINVTGEPVYNSDGTTLYVDDLGMGQTAFIVSCDVTATASYATFGDSVPYPVKLPEPPTQG